jgi:hypothetical protein
LPQLAQAQGGASVPATTPSAAATAASIGTVVTVQGNATATRKGTSSALKTNDEIFRGDILKTSANSALGVIFDDETTFNLTANASITIDDFVYQEGGNKNAATFNVVTGTVAFVASAVAKTGDMKITTPVSTLGIRGTSGLVEVGQGPSTGGVATDNIKLYPDADGHVGSIDIRGRDGTSLGTLTRGATGLAIRGGAGVRPTAVALQIPPQQVARDQSIVRQAHSTQSSGRNIVAQRRALRQPGTPRPQQLRPQQPPAPPRPTPPNPNLPKQNLQKQGGPARPDLRQPNQLTPAQQPALQQPQPALQPSQPALRQPLLPPPPRLAKPPGRRPLPGPLQKKRKPQ